MSYCRFGAGSSDVYVFLHVGGFLECCGCRFVPLTDPSPGFDTTAEMVEHLMAHREAGHLVPQYAIDGLLADAAENDAWIASEQGR